MIIKAFTTSLSLLLFVGAAATVSSQVLPSEMAEVEAVRRQEAIQLLHMKLADAQSLQKSLRWVEAAKAYEDAYGLFSRVGLAGDNVEADKNAVIAGLVETRLKLADDACRRGDLTEADSQIKRVLKVDPRNAAGLQFKLENDRLLADSKGKVPSPEILAKAPEIQNEKIQVGTAVQDARVLLEMGRVDEAEKKLRAVLRQDPTHIGAKYYMDLIQEKRYMQEITKRDVASKDAMVEVTKAWNPPVKRDNLPFPNPVLKTNLIHTSPERQVIMAKLNSIRLNEVSYDGLLLMEVLKDLTDQSIKRDPEKVGLNFMINPHSEAAAAAPTPAPTDPTQPQFDFAPAPAFDISTVTVKISPPMRNLRLLDVLDAITTAADQPVRYELRDYAIVFSPKPAEPIQLMTRQFKVDPNTFLQGLESVYAFEMGANVGGGGSGGGGRSGRSGGDDESTGFNVPRVLLANPMGRGSRGGSGTTVAGVGLNYVNKSNYTATVNEMVRNYFTTAGVDLNPPKSVFFNDRQGMLMVRATAEDLDIIEMAIQTLNIAPPQVHIEAKFAEVTQTDSRGLGFDWILGNMQVGNGIGVDGGTAPSYHKGGRALEDDPVFPGLNGPGSISQSASDGYITAGIRNTMGAASDSIPALGTLTGILTDPQFRLVVRAIEQRGGADILAVPSVTTLSGRQAQISALDLRTIVVGNDFDSGTSSYSAPTTGAGGYNTYLPPQQTLNPYTDPTPFGPVLDVIPYVCADGYSIQMTLVPTLTEFVEYEDPGAFAPIVFTQQGDQSKAALPLPRFRIRQVTTCCIVYDGQTVVLGGLISENMRKIKDKVPMLGDIPFFGRLFRSESNTSEKRNLMIFVTPTIIDPAGNRVHSDDDLPFAKTAIPSQTASVQ